MTTIKIDLSQTIEQNANTYFERAKKARKKLLGLERAMRTQRDKPREEAKKIAKQKRKTFWFEKFRWFLSSDGFLCVGGRDATTNEIVIKKHTEPHDLVLHTDMAGSPFVIVKGEGKEIPQSTIEEAAQFTASMSRAWKNGLGTLDVFSVNPEQVSKEANAGESLPRGAFMIRGETKYLHPTLTLAASIVEYEGVRMIMISPPGINEEEMVLMQGKGKASDVAKQIQKKFADVHEDLDTIIRQLPAGGIEVL